MNDCCDFGERLQTMYEHWQKRYNEMSREDLEELLVSQDFECFEDSETFLNVCIQRFLNGEDLGENFFPFLEEKASKADLMRWKADVKVLISQELVKIITNDISAGMENLSQQRNLPKLKLECERILTEKFPNNFQNTVHIVANQLCEDILPLLPK